MAITATVLAYAGSTLAAARRGRAEPAASRPEAPRAAVPADDAPPPPRRDAAGRDAWEGVVAARLRRAGLARRDQG